MCFRYAVTNAAEQGCAELREAEPEQLTLSRAYCLHPGSRVPSSPHAGPPRSRNWPDRGKPPVSSDLVQVVGEVARDGVERVGPALDAQLECQDRDISGGAVANHGVRCLGRLKSLLLGNGTLLFCHFKATHKEIQ